MNEHHVGRDESPEEAAKRIVSHRQVPHKVPPAGESEAPLRQAIRTIVREELEKFKAEVVKQVIHDLGTELQMRQGSRKE